MAEFGKRKPAEPAQTGRPSAAVPADVAAAIEVVSTGKLPTWANSGPSWIAVVFLLAVGGIWFLILPYAGGLLRDIRLSGTWQPAYDLQVVEGKCTRYQFVVTTCHAKVRSAPEPEKPAVTIEYLMAFSGGGGEALVPVRSSSNPSAITIAYAAESKLANRTFAFGAIAAILAAMLLAVVDALVRGKYVGGAAHRALLAGLEDLNAHVEKAKSGLSPAAR